MDEAPGLRSKYEDDSLMTATAKLFLNGVNSIRNKESKSSSGAFLRLQKLQKLVEIHSEARKYRRSMADVVLDRKGKQRRLASAKESLSPNIFPMYNDKSGILPIPELLDGVGLSEKEKTAMMDLIVEASGASKLVEETMQLFQTNETLALNDEINQITQLMQQRVQQVNSSLNDEQQVDMQSQNFAFLNRSQLEMLYGSKGLANLVPFDFSEYEKMNRADLQKSLMNAVRSIADGQSLSSASFSPKRRRKRQEPVGEPGGVLVGESTILAPFIFGPDILDFVILGPVILSPYILGPVILSPSIGDPLIITPYVLSPKILSPEIWAVYVLSPYVLSPNILNPFVMSPLNIMSPNLLNAIILNPYAGSPSILTESAFVFDILSPSAFSRRRKRRIA
ncbi:hypothetical protein M3Y97_00731700 [Aphelenchoides bicaudatus]|nr:hypothetical protein M3Y97_00731700 [Aphelenchoides bicaudatus]